LTTLLFSRSLDRVHGAAGRPRGAETTGFMTDKKRQLLLLADDDPELIGILVKRLQVLECDIVTANNGADALALVREKRPDAVILDVMMPGMNGWEVCKAIRSDEALRRTPVMMLTGIGESLNEITSPLYGADDHVDKPFNFSELLFKIRRLLAAQPTR
jgi:DNA-binding response OmpR family regulator